MEKIRKATSVLDEMSMELTVLNAATFVLWDSIANGGGERKGAFAAFAYDLSNKADAFEKKYQEAVELLFEGLREEKESC